MYTNFFYIHYEYLFLRASKEKQKFPPLQSSCVFFLCSIWHGREMALMILFGVWWNTNTLQPLPHWIFDCIRLSIWDEVGWVLHFASYISFALPFVAKTPSTKIHRKLVLFGYVLLYVERISLCSNGKTKTSPSFTNNTFQSNINRWNWCFNVRSSNNNALGDCSCLV